MPPPPSPLNFPQHYDFKALTPNNYMNKDLSPIFGLNSRFGAVLESIRAFSELGLLAFAQQLGLSKSNWATPSRTLLKTALRLCRSFAHQRQLSHWVSCASVREVTG
jgi:hypothetical protein